MDIPLSEILSIIVPDIVKEIINYYNLSEDKAIEELYMSRLYELLEEEETKLWHLSPKCLFDLFRQEKELGKIEFPEEA